jgi:hypothetical protein
MGLYGPVPGSAPARLWRGPRSMRLASKPSTQKTGVWVQTRTQRSGNWGGSNVDGACVFNGVSSAAVSGKAPQTTQRYMRHGIRVLPGRREVERPSGLHAPTAGRARAAGHDFIWDEARQALVELVPDMIGLTGADLRIDLRVALRAARTALPIVAEERQQIMAVAVLTCERLRADLDGCPGAPLSQESSDALALAPEAATWACRYTRNLSISQTGIPSADGADHRPLCRARHRAWLHTQPGLAPARPAGWGNRGL